MVIAPDVTENLPYIKKDGIKYFQLTVEKVKREILPGIFINAWGYNGSIPGPTIKVYPNDYICIRVFNKLNTPTSIHWHGLDVPNDMDGVPAIEPSPKIMPNTYFDYHFRIINPPGTYMYHSHYHTVKQDQMGLVGGFIILNPEKENIQKDYLLHLSEFNLKDLKMFEVKKGTYDINPFAMNTNFFCINGRCFPYTTPLEVEEGDNVRIRLTNVGINNHPIHFHGHQFAVTGADGNPIPKHLQIMKNTILVGSGETWDFVFLANNPGKWPLHCHLTHHVSNNMTLPLGGMTTSVNYKNA